MNNLKPWKPQQKSLIILERAWEHIQSVPYRVGLRWLFYRLLQDGLYTKKGDYHSKMVPLFSDARKAFYRRWRPDTLADETREMEKGGYGYDGPETWYEALATGISASFDKWSTQPYYLIIMYEAKAMSGQFRQYAHYFLPFDQHFPYTLCPTFSCWPPTFTWPLF